MTDKVLLTIEGDVGIVTLNSPPVNALSQEIRKGLLDAFSKIEKDNSLKAVVLMGHDRNFSAGADISEFGNTSLEPALPMVCQTIESTKKPVIAAISGVALGGGFELALASHYRMSTNSAKVGLPEVHLGLIPGAGGTQRLPRIVGPQLSLEMITSGKPIKAKKAQAEGLIDQIIEDTASLKEEAIQYAHTLIKENQGPRRSSERKEQLEKQGDDKEIFINFKNSLQKTARGLYSPFKAVDAIKTAFTLPFVEGIKKERDIFLDCMSSAQSKGLVHAFFSERKCSKFPEALDDNEPARKLDALGVVGGGTMGSGIAVAALDAGLTVTMVERDEESIEKGKHNVTKVYKRHIEKGRMTEDQVNKVLERYNPSTNFEDLKNVDMVIEAVFEELNVKQEVFKTLDNVIRPGAVMASNTSYLNIDKIAAVTSRPQDVLGLHFFSPANIMKLLEVVIPSNVKADVVNTGLSLAKKMKKVPVRAGNCDGFIGNRILSKYGKVVAYMMEDGASPYDIDKAIFKFGLPMGIFQMFDLAGLDIGWANRKRQAATRDPKERYVHILDLLCEKGNYGQKTGRGFYIYQEGARRGEEDPEVLELIDEERKRKGITPRQFTEEEILDRYIAAMVNESCNVLHEGMASRPSDIDITLLYGYGFPRHRGGPMKYADQIGLSKILDNIKRYSEEDSFFWSPSPLLIDLVDKGQNFDSLNK
ncbi:MAG: 3-hydroxyacyl-CoA dehydrogenase [Halobacteriovoraceae bacterium]|nr:3-hydroxyacyl-CoA dehydrogenase [Halobacteriovoraceae bacterium]